jgi:DNA invertase Pin-like site-specific DNA recombinase
MKAGLYIRVSTANGQTTDNQRRELESYCQRQGWTVTAVYDDTGVSGSKSDRPALNRLLKDAAKGRLEVVVVWKIDRLARSVVHLLQVLQQLQASGVGFVAATQQIDTTTAYGRMVLTFLGAVSEFERELIIERVKIGISRAKSQGVHCGRPKVSLDVERVVQLRKEGVSIREIAKTLKVGCGTVCRSLLGDVPKAPEK